MAERALPRVSRRRVGAQDPRPAVRLRRDLCEKGATARPKPRPAPRAATECPIPASSTTRRVRQAAREQPGRARAASGRRCRRPARAPAARSRPAGRPGSPRSRSRGTGARSRRQAFASSAERYSSRIAGSRSSDAAANGGFFDQNSATHRSMPIASIRSAEASMRGARFERFASAPISTRARTPSGCSSAYLSAIARAERVADEHRALELESGEQLSKVGRPLGQGRAPAARARACAPAPLRSTATTLCPGPSVSRTRLQSAPDRPSPWISTTGDALARLLDTDLERIDDHSLLCHIVPLGCPSWSPERSRPHRAPVQ